MKAAAETTLAIAADPSASVRGSVLPPCCTGARLYHLPRVHMIAPGFLNSVVRSNAHALLIGGLAILASGKLSRLTCVSSLYCLHAISFG